MTLHPDFGLAARAPHACALLVVDGRVPRAIRSRRAGIADACGAA